VAHAKLGASALCLPSKSRSGGTSLGESGSAREARTLSEPVTSHLSPPPSVLRRDSHRAASRTRRIRTGCPVDITPRYCGAIHTGLRPAHTNGLPGGHHPRYCGAIHTGLRPARAAYERAARWTSPPRYLPRFTPGCVPHALHTNGLSGGRTRAACRTRCIRTGLFHVKRRCGERHPAQSAPTTRSADVFTRSRGLAGGPHDCTDARAAPLVESVWFFACSGASSCQCTLAAVGGAREVRGA
jgi:hypothetical protein